MDTAAAAAVVGDQLAAPATVGPRGGGGIRAEPRDGGERGEVWGHGADEERHEAGRVGAALERAILHDLVGDVVAEMLAQSAAPTPHPFVHGAGAAMCRKRLVF